MRLPQFSFWIPVGISQLPHSLSNKLDKNSSVLGGTVLNLIDYEKKNSLENDHLPQQYLRRNLGRNEASQPVQCQQSL